MDTTTGYGTLVWILGLDIFFSSLRYSRSTLLFGLGWYMYKESLSFLHLEEHIAPNCESLDLSHYRPQW